MTCKAEERWALEIKYFYEMKSGRSVEYRVQVGERRRSCELCTIGPDWARLECHRCPFCELEPSNYFYCPAAISIADIVNDFSKMLSFDIVRCRVEIGDKTIQSRQPIQRCIGSLMGLRFATSGCPILSRFLLMARFHEPFSDPFATSYRTLAMCLVEQFINFPKTERCIFDLTDLQAFYANVSVVNRCLSERIRDISGMDAVPNGLVVLDSLKSLAEDDMETFIERLKGAFLQRG